MSFSSEEVREFITEAEELLDEAEKSLLSVENGAPFKEHYDAIFRAFHSIKGASGMLELNDLQQHMHKMENLFGEFKNQNSIPSEATSFFLNGIDAARTCMRGEEFTFTYEIKKQTQQQTVKTPAVEKKTSSEPLIYIVDDEAQIVEILTDLLLGAKYNCQGFTKVSDLLSAIEKNIPMLIISDINMPEMTGFDLLNAIKKIDKNLPVIFVSAFLSKENLMEALSKGVFGVIEKPFKPMSVLPQVADAIERYKLWKLLNRSIDLMLFQLTDLGDFLNKTDRKETYKIMKDEMAQLIEARRKLKN